MCPRILGPTEDKKSIQGAWRVLRFGRAFRLHQPIQSAKIVTDLDDGTAWLEVDDTDLDRSVSLLEAAGVL